MGNLNESNEVPKRGRGGYQRGRSRKGCPNRTTQAAREVVTLFVEGNLPKLQAWLDQVAEGVWDEHEEKWAVKPDPQAAFLMVMSLMEYHLPKLARTDVRMPGELTVKTFHLKKVASHEGAVASNPPIYDQDI